jgi:hypothetical protein
MTLKELPHLRMPINFVKTILKDLFSEIYGKSSMQNESNKN